MNIESMTKQKMRSIKRIKYIEKLKKIDFSKYDGKRITIAINRFLDGTGFIVYRNGNSKDYYIKSIEYDKNRYHFVDRQLIDYYNRGKDKLIFDYEYLKKEIEKDIVSTTKEIERWDKGIDLYHEVLAIKKYLKSEKFKNLPYGFMSEIIGRL